MAVGEECNVNYRPDKSQFVLQLDKWIITYKVVIPIQIKTNFILVDREC